MKRERMKKRAEREVRKIVRKKTKECKGTREGEYVREKESKREGRERG